MESRGFSESRTRSVREKIYKAVFFFCAAATVLITVGIIFTLLFEAMEFFREVSPAEFFLGTNWAPTFGDREFGVLPLVSGTLIVTINSALIALPIGLATAIYLSEYASNRMRSVLKPLLEILAGVPTVVYGFFALVYITPALDALLPVDLSTFNSLSASIVVGIMIIPMVSSVSEDSMSSVPDSLRNAAYGLGATKLQVSTRVVVPASISGILSSYILALSRAIGETMAVTVAMGMTSNLVNPLNPGDALKPAQTMTSAMVELSTGDIAGGGVEYQALFAIGITLFVITFVMNLISDVVTQKYREEY